MKFLATTVSYSSRTLVMICNCFDLWDKFVLYLSGQVMIVFANVIKRFAFNRLSLEFGPVTFQTLCYLQIGVILFTETDRK